MLNLLISVIIPVYNVEKYLHKCVDSVLAQTYQNLEIILVDDGSTDSSGKICDEYAQKENRINVIHKKNGGLSSARNAGIDIAKGEFLAFIDSDDWVDAQFIEILYETLCKYHTQIACVGYYEVDQRGSRAILPLSTQQQTLVSHEQAIEMGFSSLGFFACNKLFAKTLFQEIRFPFGQLFEDLSTTSKLFLKADRIAISNKPLYYYNRLNMGSITKADFAVKKLDYFKATGEILSYAVSANNKKLIYVIEQERAYHIAGFFRQMAAVRFEDKNIINPLQKELRRNIGKLWKTKHKLSNKLFALACCVNFFWAAKADRWLEKRFRV